MNERGQIRSRKMCASARVLTESFASLLLFYLLEAVVHHRAESLRHHQADPDGQQQARDDPDRGDKARFAGHVGDATSPTSFENE